MEYIKFIICVICILIAFGIVYLSNNKQNKKIIKMQKEIKKDDKIITISGIVGTVKEVEEDRVVIEVEPDKNKLTIEKWAIAGLDKIE